MQLGHRGETSRLTFRALALGQSEQELGNTSHRCSFIISLEIYSLGLQDELSLQ